MTGQCLGHGKGTLGDHAGRPAGERCHTLPKAEPLPGSLHAEWKTCGTPTCRCMRGEPHGPYWTLRWREDGRQRRRYITPAELEQVRAGLAEWRRLHPPARSEREALAALRWLQEHYPQDRGHEAVEPGTRSAGGGRSRTRAAGRRAAKERGG